MLPIMCVTLLSLLLTTPACGNKMVHAVVFCVACVFVASVRVGMMDASRMNADSTCCSDRSLSVGTIDSTKLGQAANHLELLKVPSRREQDPDKRKNVRKRLTVFVPLVATRSLSSRQCLFRSLSRLSPLHGLSVLSLSLVSLAFCLTSPFALSLSAHPLGPFPLSTYHSFIAAPCGAMANASGTNERRGGLKALAPPGRSGAY